jgi:hypothetical protein
MTALIFVLRLLSSMVVGVSAYMITNGVWFFLLCGLLVASVLLVSQYPEHRKSKHSPRMYSFIFLFDIVLWPSAIYLNIRQAYGRRSNV